MCWVFGHEWVWLSRDTACNDVLRCYRCGVTVRVPSVPVTTTSTIGS